MDLIHTLKEKVKVLQESTDKGEKVCDTLNALHQASDVVVQIIGGKEAGPLFPCPPSALVTVAEVDVIAKLVLAALFHGTRFFCKSNPELLCNLLQQAHSWIQVLRRREPLDASTKSLIFHRLANKSASYARDDDISKTLLLLSVDFVRHCSVRDARAHLLDTRSWMILASNIICIRDSY